MTHDQKAALSALAKWGLTALIGVLTYLAVELRSDVATLKRVDAERSIQIEVLKNDLAYIKASLLRIENRLERTQ